MEALARVMQQLGAEYKVISQTQADLFGEHNISKLTIALSQEGCIVHRIYEKDETLESYYVNLVGGGRHD